MSDMDAMSTASVRPSWYQRRRLAGAFRGCHSMMSAPRTALKPCALWPITTCRQCSMARGSRRAA